MEIKIGLVVELNAGPFGGERGVVMDLGVVDTPAGPVEVCRLGMPGFGAGLDLVCPPSEFKVIGEVGR